jgi:hypothetical protein
MMMGEQLIAGSPDEVLHRLLLLIEETGPFGRLVLTSYDWDDKKGERTRLAASSSRPSFSPVLPDAGDSARITIDLISAYSPKRDPSMTDPDETLRQQEHWRALAEQLGLAPDPEIPVSQSLSRPAADTAVREEFHQQPAPPSTAPELPRVDTSRPAAPPDEGPAPEQEDAAPPLERGRSSVPAEESAEVRAEAAEKTGQIQDRRRPRSRGRRSSRAARAEPDSGVEAASEETAADVASSAEKPVESSRRRGRGRPRRRRSSMEEATESLVAPELEEETEPEATPEPESDEDEPDTLSDWNVPSWNDLIASLYRPER